MSASAEARAARLVLIAIALSTALRLALGYGLGLGVDEAYTVGVTAAFQWSWFDHPPLAFWMVYAMQAIGAPRAPELLLRLPFIIAFSVSIWAMFTLVRRVHGAEAGVWAAVSLCLAPFFAIAAGTWTLPDGPLILALLLAAMRSCGSCSKAPPGAGRGRSGSPRGRLSALRACRSITRC